MNMIDPQAILDTPMQTNDAGAETVGGYLVALAREVWQENEGFSGKRPFGNSGWPHEVYNALAAAGHVESTDDGYGGREVSHEQQRIADGLVYAALDELALPLTEPAVEVTSEPVELPATALNVSQQIRLEAARLLLSEWPSMASTQAGSDDAGTIKDFVADLLHLAAAIETGAAPEPADG